MKKFKVFECFAGIGAQNRAMKNLLSNDFLLNKLKIDNTQIGYEVVGTAEWFIDAIIGYDLIHHGEQDVFQNYNNLVKEDMLEFISTFVLSKDSKIPYRFEQISRLPYDDIRQLYIALNRNKNFGSILDLKGQTIVEKTRGIDLLTYSFPCFIAGTLILTSKGYKKIEEINNEDLVLTHTNTYQKVVKPMINHANHIYKLDSMASESLYVTEEHPFYARKKEHKYNNINKKTTRVFDNPEWIETKNLSKDYYLSIAINQNSKLPEWEGVIDNRYGHNKNVNKLSEFFENKLFWWLIGVYIGDGWTITNESNYSYRTIICTSKINEQHKQLEDVLNKLNIKFNKVEEKTTFKYHLVWKELTFFLNQFGKYAYGKRLNNTIFDLPKDLITSFIEGYLFADGSYIKSCNNYKIHTVSKELAYGIGQCIAKGYETPYKIYKQENKKKKIIEGREINQRDSYQVVFKTTKNIQDKAFYENGYIWFPINSLEKLEYKGNVYNFEVENDNSYTVNNIIVHNCQDISLAGKGAGLEIGTRSGLLWEIKRVLEELRDLNKLPKFLLMENVKALFDDKHYDGWKIFEDFLVELGYKNNTFILNSLDFGIPQSRDRVFCVSELNGKTNITNIIKQELNTSLKEFLNVDNDSYINEYKASMPNNTPSRIDIIENSKKLNNIDYCFTITTKADRKPNPGVFWCDSNGKLIDNEERNWNINGEDITGKSPYRYLTPREALLLMGFTNEDYDIMIKNNINRNTIYMFAGNSIVVNVLEAIFGNILAKYMGKIK